MKFHNLFIVASFILATSACSHNQKDDGSTNTVNVFAVSPLNCDSTMSRTFAGRVKEGRSISLGFKTAGQIERIYVNEGSVVKEGQLIAQLDTVDYALALRQAQIQYNQAESQYQRQKYLHEHGNMSANDFERNTAQLQQLGIQLESNKNKMRYTSLYAPASGVVTALNHEKAEMVDAGTPIIELMDNSGMEIIVDLPASDFNSRNEFTEFNCILPDGHGFTAQLLSITPKADNNQLYRMRLGVPTTVKERLSSGMNISVNATRKTSVDGNSVIVPLRSVFNNNGISYVWAILPDSTITAKAIQIGTPLEDNVTVTSGLTGSETLVRSGVHTLREGQKVNILHESAASNIGKLL